MKPLFLLFLNDSREVKLYEDLDYLKVCIEAIDVDAGTYDCFDSKGYRVDLLTDDAGLVLALLTASEQPEAARGKIIEFYSDENPDFARDLTLSEMVQKLAAIYPVRRSPESRIKAVVDRLLDRKSRT